MEKRRMIIAVKQCGAYTTHCQLHGEPTEHPPYTHVKFNIDGGKVAHINLHENALNIQVLEAIGVMGFDIDKYDYEFVRWENFSLLNKAPVSGELVAFAQWLYEKGYANIPDTMIAEYKQATNLR